MNIIKSGSLELRSGLLLSREILEQMDLQSRLFQIQYDTCPDGIIYGFELIEEKKKLYLSSGLIKHGGKYFFSAEKISIFEMLDRFDSEKCNNFTGYSVMAFEPCGQERKNEGIVSECLELKLIDRSDSEKGDYIIVAEFQYHNGKRTWKTDSRNAVEMLEAQLDSEEYYYTFLNVSYSMPYEKVFSPYIYDIMRNCLESKTDKSAADMMLLFTLSQNRIISFKVLENWFRENNINADFNDRKSIIREFLSYIKSGTVKRETVSAAQPAQIRTKHKKTNFGI